MINQDKFNILVFGFIIRDWECKVIANLLPLGTFPVYILKYL